MSAVLDQNQLEALIRTVLAEKLAGGERDFVTAATAGGVRRVALPTVRVGEGDRLATGHSGDRVYTKDVLTLSESPRLGCGIMEMYDTAFPWHLDYDEIDYIIEGALTIRNGDEAITAKSGECIFIPKGSDIAFAVSGFARFMYVTYPADWKA